MFNNNTSSATGFVDQSGGGFSFMQDWTGQFFNDLYLKSYTPMLTPERTAKEVECIVQALSLQPGEHVLDLACGHGRHALELARCGYGPVTGLDFSPEALGQARADAKAQNLNVDFLQGDMRQLPFESAFDAIYNYFSAMFYWDDETHSQILRDVAKALKPGGRFLLETKNREDILRFPHPQKSWSVGTGEVAWQLQEYNVDLEGGYTRTDEILLMKNGETLRRYFQTRLYTLSETIQLLKEAGFTYQTAYGAADLSPYQANSPRMIVKAVKL
jgi:SAM-dependent methyltransferase